MKINKDNLESLNVEQLLSEAEELIKQIKSDALKDIREEHIIQLEKHVQELEEIKSKVTDKMEKTEIPEIFKSAEGVHEAILDIVKAMG